MRRSLFDGWFLLGWFLALALAAGPSRAQEHGAAAAPVKREAASHTYRVEKLEGSEEKEEILHMDDPQQAQELTDLLRRGEVESLEREKPLNILAIRWDLGLWTLVVFLVLLWILSRLAWRPMLEGLRKREETIRGALADAQHASEEARSLRAKLQAELDHAQEKVRDILDQGRRDVQRVTDEMMAKARTEIQTERERLHREIDMARDQALQQLWNQTAQLATLVASKALRRQLNPEDQRRFVDEAIEELQLTGDGKEK